MCFVFPKHIPNVHPKSVPIISNARALRIEDLSCWELMEARVSELLSELTVMCAALSTRQEGRNTDMEVLLKLEKLKPELGWQVSDSSCKQFF